ncbi:MAG TPA: TonB-dependent receptor [Longimicrobiales bacterium]|nr:TonB-dependent receptor [Longimicrobiales bacterium]
MPAQAQQGQVLGRVRDDEGSAVYNARVELAQAGVFVRATETDRLGFFRLADVPPGAYTLRAGRLGYGQTAQSLGVGPGETVEVELSLPRQAVELEGITVGAERSRERIRFEEIGGATIRELALADMRQVPGVAEADPLRAVEVLPGVVSTSDFSAGYHVRGGAQDQNLILLDGVPIFSPFHLGGFFSVFNADMLDRAELQSGGFPAEHGGRVSSVLQIETDPGDGRFAVDGGVSMLASRVAVSGGFPEGFAEALGYGNVHWRASARRSYFDWLLKPAFDFPYHLQDFQAVAEGWTKGGDRLRLTAYTGDDVLALSGLDDESFPLRIDWDWGNDLVGLRWTHPRRGGGSLDIRVNGSRYATGLTFPDFGDTEFRSRISQTQARLDWEGRPTPFLKIRTGVSADVLSYDNLAESGGTEFGRGVGDGFLAGSFGQVTWSRPKAWLLEGGLRLDAWFPDPGETALEVSPRLAAKRFFHDGDYAVKLAAGRYTQFMHSLRDEELPLGLDLWVLAGARAPHLVSDQLQFGVEGYPREDWYVSLEAFTRSFDGVVTFNPGDDPNDPLDDILSGRGSSWGSDLLIRKEGGTVNGWLSLSFLKATRTFPDLLSPFQPAPSVTYPPIFDRRIDADLVLRVPLPWGWDGGIRWNVGTGTPYTRALGAYGSYSPRFVENGGRLNWDGADAEGDAFGGYAVFLQDRNASRYPTYHRLDLSARKTIRKSWGTLTPYVDVLNMYNRRNVLFYFYEYSEVPPVRSGVSMFPLLPTFGLEVHF